MPTSKTQQPSICIVGDITYDTAVYLDYLNIQELTDSIYERAKINQALGGTAVHPAIAASRLGYTNVSLISCIGVDPVSDEPDLAAQAILTYLKHHNIFLYLKRVSEFESGKTLMVYFNQDKRILVASRGANTSFTTKDVTDSIINAVGNSDILFLSGYWLMDIEQAKATLSLMEIASKRGKLVVLDIVPHQIYKILDRDSFMQYSRHANLIVSNVSTLVQLFPEVKQFDPTTELSEIAKELLQYYKVLVLFSTPDFIYAFDRNGFIVKKDTGYSQAEPHQRSGFGDRSIIELILEYYHRFTDN